MYSSYGGYGKLDFISDTTWIVRSAGIGSVITRDRRKQIRYRIRVKQKGVWGRGRGVGAGRVHGRHTASTQPVAQIYKF